MNSDISKQGYFDKLTQASNEGNGWATFILYFYVISGFILILTCFLAILCLIVSFPLISITLIALISIIAMAIAHFKTFK